MIHILKYIEYYKDYIIDINKLSLLSIYLQVINRVRGLHPYWISFIGGYPIYHTFNISKCHLFKDMLCSKILLLVLYALSNSTGFKVLTL